MEMRGEDMVGKHVDVVSSGTTKRQLSIVDVWSNLARAHILVLTRMYSLERLAILFKVVVYLATTRENKSDGDEESQPPSFQFQGHRKSQLPYLIEHTVPTSKDSNEPRYLNNNLP